mmetsp:Transcript_12012/g.28038  ORF Transcript_12012/g.28038 Transcript_12012/m.28038 type:complete len:639 (-) Transcript_12012:27-1943(-)
MADTGAVTKSGAKNAKADAQKYYKRKNDPAGLAKIEEGDKYMKEGDFGKAKQLFDEAHEICKNSTVERTAKPKGESQPKPAAETPAAAPDADALCTAKLLLSIPKENIQAKPMREGVPEHQNYAKNTAERLAEHLQATGGKYITRFPPEPNGYLHIGHAKAMNFNFGQARLAQSQGLGGETIMRFDDTNPEAEKQEYIDSILKNVEWLGNKPVRVTYSSDYFQGLYDHAVQLIKQGDAYVCHQKKEEVKASRDALRDAHIAHATSPPAAAVSPWRNSSVEDNLAKFEKMRTGQYDEGEACLRMKGDLMSDNPAMWDTAFYRIKFTAHPHSGDKWCIYPTYDYTHCIVDSMENITHSLCTLEFESRQAADGPYYWLLHKLGFYKPVTWEYSRCNVTRNVLSKRKLNQLVTHNIVNGWDDPRLLTLDGLRRRGYTASAVNSFCESIGVTRSGTITTQMPALENCIRVELDVTAPRRFAVVKPLKVELKGFKGEAVCELPNHPKNADMGSRKVVMGSSIYIERDDFKEVDEASFFGLAPGKEVGLLGTSFVVTCVEVKKGKDGKVESLVATHRERGDTKVKGNLHWVDVKTGIPAECRIYSALFTVDNPLAPPKADAAAPSGPADGAGEEEEEEDTSCLSW